MTENKPATGQNLTKAARGVIAEYPLCSCAVGVCLDQDRHSPVKCRSNKSHSEMRRHNDGGLSDEVANDNRLASATLALLLEVPVAGGGGQPVTFGNVSEINDQVSEIREWLQGFIA